MIRFLLMKETQALSTFSPEGFGGKYYSECWMIDDHRIKASISSSSNLVMFLTALERQDEWLSHCIDTILRLTFFEDGKIRQYHVPLSKVRLQN